MVPDYPALRYINQYLPQSVKIYFIFMGRRAYYCNRSYFHDTGDSPGYLLYLMENAGNERALERGLREKGLTHLLVREDLLMRFVRINLNAERQRLWDSFAASHLKRVFADGRYSLYQLHG